MISMRRKMSTTLAMTLVLLMIFPVQTLVAASSKAKTKVEHEPPGDKYIAGFQIELEAEIEDKVGLLATRCYFKAGNDEVFTFVNMRHTDDDEYRALLPAPWIDSGYIEYLFVIVNNDKQVTRTQLFKIDEKKTKKAAKWKEVNETKELRIDRVQETVEEYDQLVKEIRKQYRKKRAEYQNESQEAIEVLTEIEESLVTLNGFYDNILLSRVPISTSYGLQAPGVYTAEQIAAAGGSTAVSGATGAASAGTVKASSGGSGAAIATTIGVVALVAAGAAAGVALSNTDDDDEKEPPAVDPSAPVNINKATAANFVGTYANKDVARPTSEWRAQTTLGKKGAGSWIEWINGVRHSGNLRWSYNKSAKRMVIDYLTGAAFSGTVSGASTHNFRLAGHFAGGSPATITFKRQ